MAISDVLFEAERQITEYLVKSPLPYTSVLGRLTRLAGEMGEIREILDTPPSEVRTGPHLKSVV